MDVYNSLVIMTHADNMLIKIDGMVYIKNNITEYLETFELVFLWFYINI